MTTYLAKVGELMLKGSNIKSFEHALLYNTRSYLQGEDAKITLRAGRLYIEIADEDCEKAENCLKHLIGITGWAKVTVCKKSIDAIKEAVFALCKKEAQNGARTFKCETRRGDKSFPLNSYQINCEAASLVYDSKLLTVDVHHPDIIVFIEVREKVYIYTTSNKGARGLPVGMSGKGLLLLSGGLDSPVAGYKMISRGMEVECVYYHSYPYTSEEAQKKVEDLARILSFYGLETNLHIVPFTEVQMKIKSSSPTEWSTLLLRMCMMTVATKIAHSVSAQCIITGESLGQVASQTIENMSVTESMTDLPLLRPLVGTDKEDIVKTAEMIGTYKTSILPYEDCCVLFSPRHPILRANIKDAMEIYQNMQIEDLLQKAFNERVIKKFRLGKEEL